MRKANFWPNKQLGTLLNTFQVLVDYNFFKISKSLPLILIQHLRLCSYVSLSRWSLSLTYFASLDKEQFELVTINPGLVIGPVFPEQVFLLAWRHVFFYYNGKCNRIHYYNLQSSLMVVFSYFRFTNTCCKKKCQCCRKYNFHYAMSVMLLLPILSVSHFRVPMVRVILRFCSHYNRLLLESVKIS